MSIVPKAMVVPVVVPLLKPPLAVLLLPTNTVK
jgi:hypothetical protein